MIFVTLSEAADRGELLLAQDALCRWHRRRDGVVVIRELLVLPFARRAGLGRQMVRDVIARADGSPVRARCPASYEANGFWAKVGFRLMSQTDGVNLWELPGCPT